MYLNEWTRFRGYGSYMTFYNSFRHENMYENYGKEIDMEV
jgi:hypothetical protein